MMTETVLVILIALLVGSIFRSIGRYIGSKGVGLNIEGVRIGALIPPFRTYAIKRQSRPGSSVYKTKGYFTISPWIWSIQIYPAKAKSFLDYAIVMIAGPLYQFALTLLVVRLFLGVEPLFQVVPTLVKSGWNLQHLRATIFALDLVHPAPHMPTLNHLAQELGSTDLLRIAELVNLRGFWVKTLLTVAFYNLLWAAWSFLPLPFTTAGYLLEEAILTLFDRLSLEKQEEVIDFLEIISTSLEKVKRKWPGDDFVVHIKSKQ